MELLEGKVPPEAKYFIMSEKYQRKQESVGNILISESFFFLLHTNLTMNFANFNELQNMFNNSPLIQETLLQNFAIFCY